MADPKKSPEIVTEQELKTVLESKTFDSKTFLDLYNTWKVTKDVGAFTALRTMHESAGYNKKNIVFGAEQEMHEIAAIVQRYQDSKGAIVAGTVDKVNGTPRSISKEVADAIKVKKPELNKSLETMTMENLENSLKLTENLLKLAPSSHTTLARGMAGSMILGRLQELGYHLSIARDNKVIITSSKKDAKDVENKINTFLVTPNSPMLDVMRIGILYMSQNFQQYSASKSVDGKVSGPQTSAEYNKYLAEKNKSNDKILPEDQLFIDSFNKGGYAGYDITAVMQQSKDLDKVATFVSSNPAIVAQIQQAPSVAPATIPTNIPAPVPVSAPSTTADKAAGVVGQGIGTVAGGIGSLVGTVAAETGSTWSTILSEATKTGGAMGAIGVIGLLIGSIWKFGFWKTMMGVVGVGGASAIANAAEDGTFDKLANKMQKGGDKLANAVGKIAGDTSAVVAPAVAAAVATVSETKESTFQKKTSDLVRSDERIKGNISKHLNSSTSTQKATLEDYLKYINTDLSGKSLQVLLTPQNSEHSILSPKSSLDPSISVPANFDSQILKDILRKYFTGTSISVTKLSDATNQEAVKNAMTKAKGATTLLGAIEKIHA